MPARNIKLVLEYDGTPYKGWQKQEHAPSIQQTLEEALFKMTGEVPKLVVAGRTDAGVHAQGQVCNFLTEATIEAKRYAPGLNFHLPNSISVHHSQEVAADFSARYDSVAKRYRYRIYRGRNPAALMQHAWHHASPIDIETMRQAAKHLIGELDFEAFRSAQCDAEHARREIFEIAITKTPRLPQGDVRGDVIDIVFFGNAFCRHMCRILAGNLVEVGRGLKKPEWIAEVLASRDRKQAAQTAPAKGLTLLQVYFPGDPELANLPGRGKTP